MPRPAAADTGRGPSGTHNTRQRRAVLAELDAATEFRSAQQLHQALKRKGDSVGLATIYRTLQGLVAAGEVDTVTVDGNETAYRRCSRSHHHHLLCRQCGTTVEVGGPAVERWTAKVAAEHGFHDVDHTLELVGTCSQCRATT